MAPGGTKRVRAAAVSETTPGVATRSGKKYTTNHPAVVAEELPLEKNAAATGGQDEEEPTLDGSAFDDPINAQSNEAEASEELEIVPQGKQRAPRKPRPPTKGKLLDNMTQSMGRRLPIEIAEGKRRPEKPVQAAKLASEAGHITRKNMPILTHWKHYKNDESQLTEFMGKLSVRLAVDDKHEPTVKACNNMLQSAVR